MRMNFSGIVLGVIQWSRARIGECRAAEKGGRIASRRHCGVTKVMRIGACRAAERVDASPRAATEDSHMQ